MKAEAEVGSHFLVEEGRRACLAMVDYTLT